MRILVTGGAGYIGSHTVVALVEAGHDVTVVDDLENSSAEAVRRVEEITGATVPLHEVDLLDAPALGQALADAAPEAVIHFAALKAVGESVAQPVRYYRTNVAGTLNLVEAMDTVGCRTLVYSSSATVYGAATTMPLTEDSPLGATNPYGWTKFMSEQVLRDVAVADERWSIGLLRYFNPVGAHPSGRIGEDPRGVPNNLVPFIAQVAIGRREALTVFGDDFDTPDGTGVRDYIHVMDLADGHVAALRRLTEVSGAHAWNLGTGHGSSVKEVVAAFAAASGREIPVRTAARRPGDVAVSYADPTRAREELGWEARRDLAAMCADTWRWQEANPSGYAAG
jgi:UDP-glucose 4-epimerase